MSTKPRVLHVFKYFRPDFTGEGIFVERLSEAFQRLRPDVTHDVLVTTTPRPSGEVQAAALAKVHYLADGADGATQREIVAWLAEHGREYGVVHYHTHVDRTFLGAIALKLQGRRLLLSATLDDSVPGLLETYRPLFRPLVRRLFGVIDMFVAISPKLQAENRRFVPAAKTALVVLGIPLPDDDPGARDACRTKLAVPAGATMLVSVGGVCERKDQMFIVQQLPELLKADPHILVVFVGPVLEPAYHAEIERFIREHGLEAHVRFAGYAESPWDFYNAADLMVFASRQEGFGTVMIEAMAHGLPVVARRLPGVNDAFIEDGRTGNLFTNEVEFRGQAGELLRDEALRRRMGASAREHVAANFDIAKIAAHYLELYGLPAGHGALSPSHPATPLIHASSAYATIRRACHRIHDSSPHASSVLDFYNRSSPCVSTGRIPWGPLPMATAQDSTAFSTDVAIIKPDSKWFEIDFQQLWQFRDLLFALAWRDIRLRYRQTFLGVGWVILQPLIGALVFTVVFGLIAKMPSDGAPYIIISYSGLLGWTLFSSTLTRISSCLVANAELIRKVFFPRLLLPMGIVPCTLLDFAFGGIFMAVLMVYYKIMPGWELLLVPVCALILVVMALGVGMIAASLAVKYRDVQYIVPLFVQMLLYASPVGYSANAVPAYIKPFYDLNPLVGPIETMRWALVGLGEFQPGHLGYSIAVSAVLLAAGFVILRFNERKFADVI